MGIKPLGLGNSHNQIVYPSPQPSLLSEVEQLVQAYESKFFSEEDTTAAAKMLIEEISKLNEISVRREYFCHMLKLEVEDIQEVLLGKIEPLFDFATLFYDIEHNQAEQLIRLENTISEIIESKLKLSQLKFLCEVCVIYQDILEHLWLLPYLEYGNNCSNLLAQNKSSILSKIGQWIDILYKLANEGKIEPSIPQNLKKSVHRIFEPLSAAISGQIYALKPAIIKGHGMPSVLLEIMADIYRAEGDFYRAIFHAEQRLKILIKNLPSMDQQEDVLVQIMGLHGKLAVWNQFVLKFGKAITHSRAALEIARALHDPQKLFLYLKGTGALYLLQGEGKLAMPFYTEALSIIRTLKDPTRERRILCSIAEACLSMGEHEKAHQFYKNALDLTLLEAEKASIYLGLGRAHEDSEDYRSAEQAYEYALKIISPDDLLTKGEIHAGLSRASLATGRLEAAIVHANKALEIARLPSIQMNELEAPGNEISALSALGDIYGILGDYERELHYQKQAVEIAEKRKALGALRKAYVGLASAYGHAENYAESVNFYAKALEITKSPYNRAKILVDLGYVFYSSGFFEEAINHFNQANELQSFNIIKHSLNGLGLSYAALGQQEPAIKCVEDSINLARGSKDLLSEAAGYVNLGEVYRKFKQQELAEANYRKSIDTFNSLHETLKDYKQWQITFFEEQAKPYLRLESLFIEQGKVLQALEISELRRARALSTALLRKFSPQEKEVLSKPLGLKEISALAHKFNTTFVVYSFSPLEAIDEDNNNKYIGAWIVPSQGEILWKPLLFDTLPDEMKEPSKIFQTFPYASVRPQLGQSLDAIFSKKLSQWYEILISPIEPYLPTDPCQTVTIIPDGFLSHLPFAAFQDKGGKHFIEKHPISVAPSIKVLQLLDHCPRVLSHTSLVVGNPTTPNSEDNKLKLTEKEAREVVAPLLKTPLDKVLIQQAPTVARFLEEAWHMRWIHLGCHGLVGDKPDEKLDPYSVFEGLLKLAPDEEHARGYLHAQKIAFLHLHAELVFMSACHSGRGKIQREGSIGPIWSFLAAGALSTVASYWPVPEGDLTIQMIDVFYRHLLGIGVEKLNKAQALQKAILMAMQKEPDKPRQWGAFYLSGIIE